MNHRYTFHIFIIMILSSIMLVSCSSEKDDAVHVIEAYIQALSEKDSNQISNLSCADWEQNALIEVDSLTSVGSKVENLKCEQDGQEGDDILEIGRASCRERV